MGVLPQVTGRNVVRKSCHRFPPITRCNLDGSTGTPSDGTPVQTPGERLWELRIGRRLASVFGCQ